MQKIQIWPGIGIATEMRPEQDKIAVCQLCLCLAACTTNPSSWILDDDSVFAFILILMPRSFILIQCADFHISLSKSMLNHVFPIASCPIPPSAPTRHRVQTSRLHLQPHMSDMTRDSSSTKSRNRLSTTQVQRVCVSLPRLVLLSGLPAVAVCLIG